MSKKSLKIILIMAILFIIALAPSIFAENDVDKIDLKDETIAVSEGNIEDEKNQKDQYLYDGIIVILVLEIVLIVVAIILKNKENKDKMLIFLVGVVVGMIVATVGYYMYIKSHEAQLNNNNNKVISQSIE